MFEFYLRVELNIIWDSKYLPYKIQYLFQLFYPFDFLKRIVLIVHYCKLTLLIIIT